MKIRYLGDGSEHDGQSMLFGRMVSVGDVVDVPDQFETKARFNRFVEIVTGDVPEPKPVPQQNTGSLSKADLIALAEQHGIKIDKRWSEARIADAIIEHAK